MLKIEYSKRFKKDFQNMLKRGVKTDKFEYVLGELVNERALPAQYRDHALKGVYDGFRECHINPDWLLIYRIENDKLLLSLVRTGTHSDLF